MTSKNDKKRDDKFADAGMSGFTVFDKDGKPVSRSTPVLPKK
jgi:hypothetical protein